MNLFGGTISVTGVAFLLMCVFIIAIFGYALGGINIKGVSLGTAGVFIVALVFGMLFNDKIEAQTKGYTANAYKIIENMGLILFVTAVGYIAGPNFFKGLKKNATSYVLIGFVIILAGGLTTIGLLGVEKAIFKEDAMNSAMATGLLSGALTSTPAFSAAKACLTGDFVTECTVGHGIAYLFGVVGVVLFVQLVPKITKANMEEERGKLMVVNAGDKEEKKDLISLDAFGLFGFAIAVVVGMFIGGIKIPMGRFGTFSLGTTGGTLITALVLGHFGKFGKLKIMPEKHLLSVLRELGLMLFLIGAGVPGGAKFLEYVQVKYFLYGAVMTIVPMMVGFIIAKYALKLPLLNNLGSITGGMTSTPALGTLCQVSGTDDVANAYAATYPIALVSVVIVSQIIIMIFPC